MFVFLFKITCYTVSRTIFLTTLTSLSGARQAYSEHHNWFRCTDRRRSCYFGRHDFCNTSPQRVKSITVIPIIKVNHVGRYIFLRLLVQVLQHGPISETTLLYPYLPILNGPRADRRNHFSKNCSVSKFIHTDHFLFKMCLSDDVPFFVSPFRETHGVVISNIWDPTLTPWTSINLEAWGPMW